MESRAFYQNNKENNSSTRTSTNTNLQIQNYPYFRALYESFAFHLPTGLESTFHSPVAMVKIQITLAIAVLSCDTIKAGTQLLNTDTQ